MNYPNDPKQNSEQDFDRFLREVDDFYGEAAGLEVPSDFAARVAGMAQAEMSSGNMAPKPVWSFQAWFNDFSLTVRVGLAFSILLATFGGIRAGQAATEIIARRNSQPAIEMADPLGLAMSEQSIVQLIQRDELGNQDRNSGEQR